MTLAMVLVVVVHVGMVWGLRFGWSLDIALSKGWTGFIAFHVALIILIAASISAEPWSGRQYVYSLSDYHSWRHCSELQTRLRGDLPLAIDRRCLSDNHHCLVGVAVRQAEQVTSSLDAARFATLFEASDLKQVAELDGEVVGFVMAITDGKPFENRNYRWFTERVEHFIYIDRVIVSPTCRGHGIGREFYAAVFDAARQSGITKVCAEMDLEPPNRGSLQFHQALGFIEIGSRTAASGKRLSMQVRDLGKQSHNA